MKNIQLSVLAGSKKALDLILGGKISQAFCNTRPSGHHARPKMTNQPVSVLSIMLATKVKKVLIFDRDIS